jgi:hypothetical protein
MPQHLRSASRVLALLGLVGSLGVSAGCAGPLPPRPAEPGPVAGALQAAVPTRTESVPAADEGADGFALSSEEAGWVLLPPRESPLDPVPFTAGPQPWRTTKLDRVALRALELPLVRLAEGSTILPAERATTDRPRPSPDVPPLADGGPVPDRPARPELPVGPKAYADTLPADRPTPLAGLARPHADPVTVATDPTADASHRLARGLVGPLLEQPAPFAPLTIPDPFEDQRTIRLRTPPPEADDPLAPTARPPAPRLPVKP